MKNTLEKGFDFLIKHVIAILISFFVMSVFSAAVLNEITKTILWTVMLIIYFGIFYSAGWKIGRQDSRPYYNVTPSVIRLIKPCLITLAVPACLAILYFSNTNEKIFKLLANVWYLPLSLLYNDGSGTISVVHISYLIFVMPVFLSIGYLVGTTGFSIQDKMERIRINGINKRKQSADDERKAIIEQRRKFKK